MSPLEQLQQIEVSIRALEERMRGLRWWEWGEKRNCRQQITLLRHRGDEVHRRWILRGGGERSDSRG